MLMGISLSTRCNLVTIHDVIWFDLEVKMFAKKNVKVYFRVIADTQIW